jgi:predicted secreted Zn-dependent protease
MATKITPANLRKMENKILTKAKKSGCEDDYYFITTFQRYQIQLKILEDLEKAMSESGMMVEKSYVKGRKNLYINPAVTEYNRTTQAANNTVATLIKILQTTSQTKEEEDALDEFMRT